MNPTSDTPTQLSRSDIKPGAVLLDPDERKQFKVERIEADNAHCVSVENPTLKRTLGIEYLINKHWRLGKKAA